MSEDSKKREITKVKVSKEEAEKIYSTGGFIIIGYTFINSEKKKIPKEAKFKFVDCGVSWEYIQSIYRVGKVKDITYYADKDSIEANAMCDLMCN